MPIIFTRPSFLGSSAAGLPALTSRGPGHGPEIDYLQPGVNGLLTERDPQAYAAIHAYGDTHEDQAMLAMAHHRTYRGHVVA